MGGPTSYTGIVSTRSRRLRTIGIVLLAAVLGMAIYGYAVLMPSVARSLRDSPEGAPPAVAEHQGRVHSLGSDSRPNGRIARGPADGSAASQATPPLTRAQRVRKLRVAVALAYWGVCALLVVGVLVVAWLDLREISRQYVSERRAMWTQAVEHIKDPDDAD